MPTVSVGRDRLFVKIGKSYSQEEFETLCFEFGIELDDVQTENDEVVYKIEVAANRYDLLCVEGIARALSVFVGIGGEIPIFTVANIPRSSMLKMHVKPETSSIRPFVVCAVLRGITFDEARYKSFIDLQEKLHQNVCRQRTLVAIGTHDLDTLQGPFSYEALPPKEIEFVPLKQAKSFRGDELMEHYRSSEDKLKKFLHIIENSSVYPVIYDNNRTVLSLPPIINGAHSAITLGTKNVFIECTATDLTRAKIVLNTMVTMFSEYCENKFEVEPVEVVCSDGKGCIYPELSITSLEVTLPEIVGPIGVSLDSAEMSRAGYMEVLTWILVSREENFSMLKRGKDEEKAVTIGNYRSSGFEVVRTSLMPGLLRTLQHNIDHKKPIKIFEVGDVVALDGASDVGAINNRRLAVLYCNNNSGFEEILGLVVRIMKIVRTSGNQDNDDYMRPSDEPEFFPNRQMSIRHKGKDIGKFGIVHPEVLKNFVISYPCSFLEIDIQALL